MRSGGKVRLFSSVDEAEEVVYDLWNRPFDDVASLAVVTAAGEIIVEWEI